MKDAVCFGALKRLLLGSGRVLKLKKKGKDVNKN